MTSKQSLTPDPSVAESAEASGDPKALHVLPGISGEILHDFWLVRDMFAFENVGVSHAVNQLKYLTCADCEIGPIGYHDMEKKDEFLVAWNRVTEK